MSRREDIHLADKFKADFDYAESLKLPCQEEITSIEIFNQLKDISKNLKSMLAKLHTEMMNNNITNSLNRVKHDDLSTQTDFSPRLSQSAFLKLNKIRLQCSDPAEQISLLREKVDEVKTNQDAVINSFMSRLRIVKLQFQTLAKINGPLLKISSSNPDDIDLLDYIDQLRRDGLPKRNFESSRIYFESAMDSDLINRRHSSSQTEISTLLIGVDFEVQTPMSHSQVSIAKLNSLLISHFHKTANFNVEINRFKRFCDDLNAGKEITAFECDLEEEDVNMRLQRYRKIHDFVSLQIIEILERFSTLSEIYSSDFNYARTMKKQNPDQDEMTEQDYARLEKVSKKLLLYLDEASCPCRREILFGIHRYIHRLFAY